MMYRRFTSGLNSVGKLIPETANPYDYVKSNNKDYYLSIYKYNEQQKKDAEIKIDAEKKDKDTGKVIKYKRDKGVKTVEDVTTDLLAFDFDDEHHPEKAQKDTIETVKRLIELSFKPEDMLISFSGNKGFSLVLKHDKDITPDEHRQLADAIAGDLQTYDTSLYNASRIFRLDGTKHNKTGLYKTPLHPDDILNMSMDEIKELAKNKTELIATKTVSLPKSMFQLPSKAPQKETKLEIVQSEEEHTLNFKSKPFYLTDVKYALHEGFIPPGKGNTGLTILCATYKHVGFSKKDAYYMLKSVNEKRQEIYGNVSTSKEEIWNQVVEFVYSSRWEGGTFGKENDLIYETSQKFGITDSSRLETFDNIVKDFFDFAENINENVIKTGIKSLDDSLLITTGMMVGVLGAPSAGKTSLVTSIVEKSAKEGMKPLFHSLDMTKHLMSMRLLQKETGVSTETRLRKSINGDKTFDPNYNMRKDPQIIDAVENLGKVYRNVNFNFTRGATIESIEEDIKINKVKHGNKFKLVVVDYLEKVRGPYSDSTANSGYVASRLSDLASTYDVAIILLLQPQKSAGDPSQELLSMRKVKGASVIEQDCRVILTMWRPGFDPRGEREDKFASVAIVKNNMGEIRTLDYSWNGLKGELNELTPSEQQQLKDLRASIKEAQEQAKQNGDWGL